MSKRIQIQVFILLFIAVLAVGIVMAVAPDFSCHGECEGCSLSCEADEIDECCGFCDWPGGGPPGSGGVIYCCVGGYGCYVI